VHHAFDIMTPDQSVSDVIGKTLRNCTTLFNECEPDMVLVQGDTASAFAVALAAFLAGARVGHVEAGLRSGDLKSPFPEELMRLLVDRAADLFFAPTTLSRDNLLREGISPERIFVTGNTVTDALRVIAGADAAPESGAAWRTSGPRILVTMHRRESFGAPMLEALQAIQQLLDSHEDSCVVFPVHPNPSVRSAVEAVLAKHPRVCICEPVDYLTLIRLLSEATLILSDSGGIQEEAPSFDVPVLVLREVTERPEGLTYAENRLVGTSQTRILRAAEEMLARKAVRSVPRQPRDSVFGDGRASHRIAQIVEATLCERPIDRDAMEYRFMAPARTRRRRAV
jgi:UDP-N-acetylglucosamine 2-epimerase (non-hydrolysing)